MVWSHPFVVEMTELKLRGTMSAPALPSALLGHRECFTGVSNLQPVVCTRPTMGMNVAQHKIVYLLKT